jgi:isochorismate synthase EntC
MMKEINTNVYVGCGITKDSSPEKEWEEKQK